MDRPKKIKVSSAWGEVPPTLSDITARDLCYYLLQSRSNLNGKGAANFQASVLCKRISLFKNVFFSLLIYILLLQHIIMSVALR